jgi:hypothetical protein
MGVPDEDGLERLAEHLDDVGEPHGPVVRTPIGWLLPGVHDPDGHEMRSYVSDPQTRPDASRPRRILDAGTSAARSETLPPIDPGSEPPP